MKVQEGGAVECFVKSRIWDGMDGVAGTRWFYTNRDHRTFFPCPGPACHFILCVSSNPRGQHCDMTYIRQLLCPDPLCVLCSTTSAKISLLLSRISLKDSALSSSQVASRDTVTESSCTQTCAIAVTPPTHEIPASLLDHSSQLSTLPSPTQVPSLSNSLSSSVQDESESVPMGPNPSLDCELPVDHFLPYPISPRSPNHGTEEAKSAFQSKSSWFLKESTDELSTKDLGPAEASFGENSTVGNIKNGNSSSDIQATLERETKHLGHLLMSKQKDSFLKQKKSDTQLSSPRPASESLADQQNSAGSFPVCSSKGKGGEPHLHLKPSRPKTLEDHLEQKRSPLDRHLAVPTVPQRHNISVLSDSATNACISVIFNAITDHKSPVLPHVPPLPLPETQPQPLPQSQSHNLPPGQVQADLHSPPSILLSSPLCKGKICGKRLHTTKGERHPLMPSEIHHLDQNVLQKVQARVWGLPPAVQKSHDHFCPPASKLSQNSKSHVPISILPGDYPLSGDLRKKLEHHLRKRLIQHRWGLPYRVQESLSMMRPQRDNSKNSVSSTYGLSWISLYNSKSSQDFAMRPPMKFHERPSEMLTIAEGVKKGQGHRPVTGPQGLLLNDSWKEANNNLDLDSEKGLESHLGSSADEHSGPSNMSLRQKQLGIAMEVHIRKKSEETQEGKLPNRVQRSWHNINPTWASPEKCSSQMKDRDLGALVGDDSCPNTSQNASFLFASAVKKLEEGIPTFHKRMTQGFPPKVQESIEVFTIRQDTSQPFAHSVFRSSDTGTSGVASNTGDRKLRTTNSVMDNPHPPTSWVGKERQGAPSQSSPCTNQDLPVNIQTREGGRQTSLPPPHSNIDMASQKTITQAKRHSPNLPTRPEVSDIRSSSGRGTERLSSKMTPNIESVPMYSKFREIFKAKELCVFKQQSSNILTSESEGILETGENTNKAKSILKTETPKTRIAVAQNLTSMDIKNRLLNDLKLEIERRKLIQAQGPASGRNLASNDPNDLNVKTEVCHSQDISGNNTAAFQVPHVQVDNTESTVQQQEPCTLTQVPMRVPMRDCLLKGQEKEFPPIKKREGHPTLKTDGLGHRDSRLGICQCRRRTCPSQVMKLKKRPEAKSSPTLSLKGQPPPENHFISKVKDFFQQLCPGTKQGRQKSHLEKSTSSSSGQSRALPRGKASFTSTSRISFG
ncbi:spermatogenesis-associated protein 31D1-like [Ctenodactylus gundi]